MAEQIKSERVQIRVTPDVREEVDRQLNLERAVRAANKDHQPVTEIDVLRERAIEGLRLAWPRLVRRAQRAKVPT